MIPVGILTSVIKLFMNKPDAILFDWDGTLIDSHDCLSIAMNETLEHYGFNKWSKDKWVLWFGGSARDSFPDLFGNKWQDAHKFYLNSYIKNSKKNLIFLPYAKELLAELSNTSIKLGIVSNKTGSLLRKEIDFLGCGSFFQAKIGAGDAKEDKPSPEPILLALRQMELQTFGNIWFVGDSDLDIISGKEAFCTTFLIGHKKTQISANYSLSNLKDLKDIIFSVI